ncbi:DNA polymerase [Pseudomonas mediterranea]|uniref:DNA polymerase n=1 Tax=Pseudomonas mediterranea TaxID=183795 RepID=UPI0009E7CFEE|nr:DNA polymerase [Pseudomonas mediterranea]
MSQQLLELTFDAETFYTTKDNGYYSLTAMTAEEYIRDPRFELIGFSIKKGPAPAQWYSGDLPYLKSVVADLPWHRIIVIGHNASEFDSLILTEVLGVHPLAYACTLQMARCLHGGKQAKSLAEMCKLYNLPDKGDEVVRAINKRRLDFTPYELAAYGKYCNNDSDRCYDLYRLFLPQMPTNEVWLASLSTKMFAEAKLALDRPLLLTMQQDMLVRKGQLMDRVADILNIPKNLSPDERMLHTQKMLRKDQVLADVLKNQYDVEPPMKYSPKKKDANGNPLRVYAFAKTDEGMTALLEFEDESDEQGAEDIQALAAARLSVKSTLAESRVNRFVDISGRGLLPVPLAYGKTHTHRLAGSQKINMQNLSGTKAVNKKTRLGTLIMTPHGPDRLKDFHMVTEQVMCSNGMIYSNKGTEKCHVVGLRDTIVAPPGFKIVVADSSQIELRVCHLLAGQMDTINELRAGVDVYSSFASTLYNRVITKADYKERQHGKVGMLQLQYQSGWKSFRNAARIMGGIRLSEDEAQGTVDVYRKRFTEIPKLWRTCQLAIPKMAAGGGGYLDQWGLCKIEPGRITMPGRNPVVYHNLRQEMRPGFNDGPDELQWIYDDKEKRHEKKIYGGSVTENMCQWIARNVVFDQMLEIERRWGSYQAKGCGVALTVHDEVVCVVREDDAEDCLAFMLGAMGQPPVWWPQLPVAAEGGIGQRYSQAK